MKILVFLLSILSFAAVAQVGHTSTAELRKDKPSILPLPQQLRWDTGYFPLFKTKTILVKNALLRKEAARLADELRRKGLPMKISATAVPGEPYIELQLSTVDVPKAPEEAYQIKVSAQKVLLIANTEHGIFNGSQTLLQLMQNGVSIDACTITDWPAFQWRSYMVDVGRNFQSISTLKQQIDVMAKYKLNIFHFHPTEDIAWRIQIAKYPQLTAPEHMLRDKGSYYSIKEIHDLIQYCKDRYITLVPEIDMPGHSAAFERAMGVKMQSAKGKEIVKEILREFCKTYDVPYLHIGGDEVKITDEKFLPEVTDLIHQLGKKTIGWDPGGNLDKRTVRQLWMKDGATQKDRQYIDSRHLYINHMDPLESVTTIFGRKLGDRETGDNTVLGAALCLWHDRSILNETDLFTMNPVYPAMLTFAERAWKGGGWDPWITNIDNGNTAQLTAFRDFEKRLLDQKKVLPAGLPFPYIAQADIKWKLHGPYNNEGDLDRHFPPEKKSYTPGKESAEAIGGTVVLRHFWHPLVKGVIEDPRENTTWYATTQIWSETDTTKGFWVGFNNLSRSYNSDSPDEGTWDDRKSAVFVNGQLLLPPLWRRAGQKGNPEIPLTDEGYEFRESTMVKLKKGWNTVLVKLPVRSFKGKDWNNPVKWMFTFLPADSTAQ